MSSRYLIVLLALAAATPVQAQSFIERAVRAAAERAGTNGAASASTRPVQPRAAASASAANAGVAAAASGQAAAAFADPAPINFTSSLRGPYELEFQSDVENAERAFDTFNRVSCNDCEGGYSYDSWIQHRVPGLKDGGLERRVGEMAVGEAIRWNGASGARLALTVINNQPIGSWPCKQMKWTSVRGDQSAERLGLFCYGKEGDYLSDGWVEVL